jgi:tellurite resistance protein TerC
MQFAAWGGFLLMIGFFLALDLGVFHKKAETPTTESALRWTLVWVCVALAFNGGVYYLYENKLLGLGLAEGEGAIRSGKDASTLFLTAYIVELSLSLDNIFVMALIFRFFKIAGEVQHRLLFWGILGAIILRITMILLGAALIKAFSFSLQLFGALLVYTALKMFFSKGDDDFDPEDSFVVKAARKILPVSPKPDGEHFFTKVNGRTMVTPLFLVLLVIEGSDVVFAVDSIPAVFGVTQDPFIVFTSNIFAILGLRSLYFALASLLRQFAYLKYSLMFVLFFVGMKMIVLVWDIHVPSYVSLGVILGTLGAGVVASIFLRKEEEEPLSEVAPSPPKDEEDPAPAKGDGSHGA